MAVSSDTEYMRLALSLAEKGRGKTAPNPMVGAVIVRNGKIIGKGYHRAVGEDHAEVAAIKCARGNSRGAVLYVNLEPCCHTGRTGPCTDAVLKAGISKVVVSIRDPDPNVNGKGIRLLRKAGVEVKTGLLRAEASRLNDTYIGYHKNGRPFVTLKLAQTIDGRIASVSGDSRWISSAESLEMAHRLRAEVGAVVIGTGTLRQDNPALTVRHVKGENPYRIVLSQSLDFPPQARLLRDNSDFKTILATTEESMKRFCKKKSGRNVIYWSLRRASDGHIDLHDFMDKASEFGLQSILMEGGATLATAFLKAGLVDKCVVITAPIILGSGLNAVGELSIRKLSEAIMFDHPCFCRSGIDSVFVGYPRRSN